MFISLTFLVLGFHRFVSIVANSGQAVDDDKPFMVYLISACTQDESLCGGSLISASQILTTANCLLDVKHLYAIAGYRIYVPEGDRGTDDCIKHQKKRIVNKIVPEGFQTKVMRDRFNIGIGVVESPYDPSDNSYRARCSYIPKPIKINFDLRIEVLHTSVLAFGWGTDQTDKELSEFVKSNELRAASSELTDIEKCMTLIAPYRSDVRVPMLLCALGNVTGGFQPSGVFRTGHYKNRIDCRARLRGRRDNCEDDNLPLQDDPAAINETEGGFPQTIATTETRRRVKREITVCAFDEGGPLVTWAGKFPLLIGVALPGFTRWTDNTVYCTPGSGFFISTAQDRTLVRCLLAGGDNSELTNVCKLMDLGIKNIDDTDWST